jgi:hypothetical protein
MKSSPLFFAFSLALTACGGNDFTAFDDPAQEAGAAGAGGDVDPGTGGSAAVGSGGTSAGAGSGGSVPVGGAAAGDAGAPAGGASSAGEAGSPSGGSAGASGGPSGGTAGSGPICAPEEAITAAAIPESFAWNGFSARFEDVDQAYCASSPGATCALRNAEVTFHAEGGGLTVWFNLTCQPAFFSGLCGNEEACATTIDQSTSASAVLGITASGDGYRLTGGAAANAPRLAEPTACWTALVGGGGSAAPSDDGRSDLARDIGTWLESLTFLCP